MSRKPIIAAIIPARMDSSRFPGKPLISILGMPMIEHVRLRLETVKMLDHVVVATCDQEIREVVERNGGKVIMTSPDHQRASDRVAEAARKIKADIVINAQGDEPMILPQSIELVCEPLVRNPQLVCSNIIYPIHNADDLRDTNHVKAVMSQSHRILYLSRAAIPGHAFNSKLRYYKQSGIMAFTSQSLQQFIELEPTPLEIQESVDLLRLLEHDLWVQGVYTDLETKGVDVPAQVAMVEQAILNDPLQKSLFDKIKTRI